MSMATIVRKGGQSYLDGEDNSRQEAEIFAIRIFGRSLSGVTFHEQEPQPSVGAAPFWVEMRNVRSNNEAVACPSCRRGEPCVENERIVAETRERELRRRLVLALIGQHESLNLQNRGATNRCISGRYCQTCALIAEARW
jgi:hypothetical protein